MKNNKKGFTLIELLAVIVILAILAGITAIMVTNYIENSKINADRLNAQNITNAVLREWQVQGNESNRKVYVFVDEDPSKVIQMIYLKNHLLIVHGQIMAIKQQEQSLM